MKRLLAATGTVAVCVLALGVPGRETAHSPGRVFDPEGWFQCESNSDCVLLSGSACTAPVAIHAAFVTAYNRKHSADPVCGPTAPGESGAPGHLAVCRNDRCTVVEGSGQE